MERIKLLEEQIADLKEIIRLKNEIIEILKKPHTNTITVPNGTTGGYLQGTPCKHEFPNLISNMPTRCIKCGTLPINYTFTGNSSTVD